LIHDLSRFKIFRWVTFAFGAGLGILVTSRIVTHLLDSYASLLIGFVFGCIYGSIRTILGEHHQPNLKRLVGLGIGLVVGFLLVGLNETPLLEATTPSYLKLMFAGALASVAMILPGVPGGPILVIMNVYYPILLALANLEWSTLGVYLMGSLIGIVGFSNILDRVYRRYRETLSWVFVGLVVGASKKFLPFAAPHPFLFFLLASVGFLFIWTWSRKHMS